MPGLINVVCQKCNIVDQQGPHLPIFYKWFLIKVFNFNEKLQYIIMPSKMTKCRSSFNCHYISYKENKHEYFIIVNFLLQKFTNEKWFLQIHIMRSFLTFNIQFSRQLRFFFFRVKKGKIDEIASCSQSY